MSNVEFIDEQNQSVQQFRSRRILGDYTTPASSRFLLKTGLAKNAKEAHYILVGLMLICFLMAGLITYVYAFGNSLFPAATSAQTPSSGTSINRRAVPAVTSQ